MHPADGTPQFLVLVHVGAKQQLFPACAGHAKVDRRKNAFIREFAVKNQLHIPRPLELLKYQIIHPGVGFDQGSGEDCQRTAPFVFPRGTENTLGDFQRTGINAAAHRPAASALMQVESPAKACEGIQKENDVVAGFDFPFCVLKNKLCEMHVGSTFAVA